MGFMYWRKQGGDGTRQQLVRLNEQDNYRRSVVLSSSWRVPSPTLRRVFRRVQTMKLSDRVFGRRIRILTLEFVLTATLGVGCISLNKPTQVQECAKAGN